MWSQFTNVTDRRTDGQTDRQTTCDRNTALCTKVHRAVKTMLEQRCVIKQSNARFLCRSGTSCYCYLVIIFVDWRLKSNSHLPVEEQLTTAGRFVAAINLCYAARKRIESHSSSIPGSLLHSRSISVFRSHSSEFWDPDRRSAPLEWTLAPLAPLLLPAHTESRFCCKTWCNYNMNLNRQL